MFHHDPASINSSRLPARSSSLDLSLPTMEGFSLITHIPTNGPTRIWRDGGGEVKVLSNDIISTIERSGESKFYLANPHLFAMEDLGSGSISVASMNGEHPTRAVAQMLSIDPGGSRLEVSVAGTSYGYTHKQRITALALTTRENHIYFGDIDGGVYGGFVKPDGKFVVGLLFKVNSIRDSMIVGISVANDFSAAVTASGKFMERSFKNSGYGPLSQVARRNGGKASTQVLTLRELHFPENESGQSLNGHLDPTVDSAQNRVSGFAYISPTTLAFVLERGDIAIYKRLNAVK